MRIIGIGDNVCDKYRTISTMFPGGQALNVAVYCRLQGCFSAYMGVFGTDRVGNHIKETLTAVGVDFSRCRTYEGENGYAVVDLIDGDRSFVSSNKGGVLREHPLRLTASDLSYIDSFEVVHTSNNSYFDDQLSLLKPLVPLVSYDFSRSWEDIERRQHICPWLDIGFLSCSDSDEDSVRTLLEQIHEEGCGIAVATMGSRGAMAWDGREMAYHTPKLVQAVDTLGAGDSFAAGFLMRYLELKTSGACSKPYLRQCMEAGAELSAQTCMVHGAFGFGVPIE